MMDFTLRSFLRAGAAALAGLLAAALSTSPAFGWGSQGHRLITEQAVAHLPLPLKAFFSANMVTVADQASSEPPGAHYIDIDVYPEFFAGTFPRQLDDAIATYGLSTLQANGMGPWTYRDYVTSLTAQMRAATTPAQWQSLLSTAAAAAHYIEDMHNPLHLTKNYNGQLTGNNGIHSRYETQMVNRNLANFEIVPVEAPYIPSLLDFVFDGIDQRYMYVDDIMAADDAAPRPYNTAYYNSMWAQTQSFTRALFQDATVAVASTWYTAWENAGRPRTFLAHTADFEADGDVDRFDLAVWAADFGTTRPAGDADSNGETEGADLLLWQRQLSGGASLPTGSSVPEPNVGALIAFATVAAAVTRRSARPRNAAT